MKNHDNEMNMTEGPLWNKIIVYVIPLMLSGILQLLYNAADNVVVGRYAADGKAALAAVSSTGSLINLIVNLFIGLSVGTSIAVAKYTGAKSGRDVSETVQTSVAISVLFGLALVFIGVCFAKPMLRLMDSPDDVIDLAAVYLRIYFAGMPFNMAYNFGSAVLRAVGDTKRPMYILMLSGAVNVVLNLFFVIVLHIDVAGVALATIISQAISAVLVIACLVRNQGDTHLDIRRMKIYPAKLKELAACGLPAGMQGMMFSISNVMIQSNVNSFGSAVMAGNGAAGNIEGFVYIVMNAMYQGCLAFVGQNFGARKYKRIKRSLLLCLLYVTVLGIIFGVSLYHIGDTLLGIYNPERDTEIIGAGMTRLAIVCVWYFLDGQMDVISGAMRGMQKTILPMVVTMMGACVLRIIWMATIYKLYPTLKVLYVCYPVSWTLTTAVHAICFTVVYKKEKHLSVDNA